MQNGLRSQPQLQPSHRKVSRLYRKTKLSDGSPGEHNAKQQQDCPQKCPGKAIGTKKNWNKGFPLIFE